MLRLLAAGALLAIIAASWLIFGQSSDKDEAQKRSSEAGSGANNSGTESGAGIARERPGANVPPPLRMTGSDSTGTPGNGVATTSSLAEIFDREEVDTSLAEERTKMIRSVTDALLEDGEYSAQLAEVQCKDRHCRIKVTGDDQQSVAALVGAMQDERGFYGKAENLMMSRDGDEIHVYLQFADAKTDGSAAGE